MSQKNFASYGDMETLVAEIADKCGPYTEISYEDWLQLTPYQQEHGRWDVTGVPGADGTISIDLMTKLWENESPTSSFAAGNITLSSSDYDLLLLVCRLSPTYAGTTSYVSPKGMGGKWDLASFTSTGAQNWIRFTEYVNDTTINIHDAYYVIPGQTETVDNTKLIPYQIYGIKLHHTVEMNAIAPTVSTLAENCMMSDGVTSVEDEIVRKNVANITAQATGLTSYSSASNPYTCPGDGYVRFVGTASTMATMYLLTADGTNNYTIGQTKDMYISIFVRKDAKVFLQSAVNASFLRL